MFKHIVLFFSVIQLVHGSSLRSDIWWSRRSETSTPDCDIAFDYENPSLEAKICGYCFASCQQQLATCLLSQINKSLNGSLEYCQAKCNQCEKRCLRDKRTGRIAAENWAKVVHVLQQFQVDWPVKEVEKPATQK